MKKPRWDWLAPLVPLLLLAALGEASARLGWVPEFLLPAPSSVLRAMLEFRAALTEALGETFLGALGGLALSFGIGTAFAALLASSRVLRAAFKPYTILFQTVPVVAIAPMLVIWVGYGLSTVIASAFICSVFPVISATLSGLEATPAPLHDLFSLYGASPLARLLKLRIPAALPYVFSGLRIAAGLAVIGAIVGEFIAGGGLGALVDAARTQQRTDEIFAAVLTSTTLGLVFVALIDGSAQLVLRRWHAR